MRTVPQRETFPVSRNDLTHLFLSDLSSHSSFCLSCPFSGHEALGYLPNNSVTSLAKGCCPVWCLSLPRLLLPKTSSLITSFSSLESLSIHSPSVVLPDHLILKLQASHPHYPPPYPDLHSIFPENSSPSNTKNAYFLCSLFTSGSTPPPLPLHPLVFCLKYKKEKRNIDHDCLYVLSMP